MVLLHLSNFCLCAWVLLQIFWTLSKSFNLSRMNTEKSLGDLWRLAVRQTPVKDHQPQLKWKTLKEYIIIMIIIIITTTTTNKDRRPCLLLLFFLIKSNATNRDIFILSLFIVLDASLLNTQHYNVWIMGKVELSRERRSVLLYTTSVY